MQQLLLQEDGCSGARQSFIDTIIIKIMIKALRGDANTARWL